MNRSGATPIRLLAGFVLAWTFDCIQFASADAARTPAQARSHGQFESAADRGSLERALEMALESEPGADAYHRNAGTKAAPSDMFGVAVALSGDTALVGAALHDTASGINSGAAYVFTRNGAGWSLQARLEPGIEGGVESFGRSVALSGSTALVGAGTTLAGTAFVFTRTGSAWSQQAQLTPGDGSLGDDFGASVALSGDTAVVGMPFDDTGRGLDAGSAYVYTRSGALWSLQRKLTAAAGAQDDYFGGSVAVSGDTVLVGTYGDNPPGGINAGAAYVFIRSGEMWSQQAKLVAADRAVFDYFGVSVALSGDTALIGANEDDTARGTDAGSAYVFVRSGGAWTEQAKLGAADGAAGDFYGGSVSLSGDTALVGALRHDSSGGADAGSAYAYTRNGGTWAQQARLSALDGAAVDQFGSAVAIAGETALVGAFADDVSAGVDAGSAYTFVRNDNTWSQQAQLLAGDVQGIDVANVTGGWFDPQQSGHGLLVEHLADDRVIASFYTFTPGGQQVWFVGVGTLVGNVAVLDTLLVENGRFPPQFQAASLVRTPHGTMTLRFDSCDSGELAFNFPAPYGSGTMPLRRPVLAAGVTCSGTAQEGTDAALSEGKLAVLHSSARASPGAKATGPVAALTGSWANMSELGHGFQMEVLGGDQLLVAWYVFTTTGEQLWLIGVGPIVGQTAVIPALRTLGGRFIPNFNPNLITRPSLGNMTVTATGCNSARVDYAFGAPFGSGTQPIARISQPRGVSCSP